MTDTQFISITRLKAIVIAEKSASSARNYLAMINILRSYLSSDNINPDDINSEFVTGFGSYMLSQDIAPSTAKLYQQMLRALLNKHLDSSYKPRIKEAFHKVGSKNESATNLITLDEIKLIRSNKLQNIPALKKVRDVFMFSLYGGGMSLEEIRANVHDEDTELSDISSQQEAIIRQFRSGYGESFSKYIHSLSDNEYASRLDIIGKHLRIRTPLTPQSSADGWVKAAITCGIPLDIISACLRNETAYTRDSESKEIDPASRLYYYRKVADLIHDIHPHWYVIRTTGERAEIISRQVCDKYTAEYNTDIDTFVPPAIRSKRAVTQNVLRDIFFLRCTPEYAVELKKSLYPKAYIYTSHSTGRPSVVPDHEMKMFMLLSNIASDTIEYYFPEIQTDAPQFNTNDRVTIIDGNLSGQVGVVQRLSDDKLKVFIRIEAFNGMIITAEIHKSFLRTAEN